MFYYCERCAHIENIKETKSGENECPACSTKLKVVPDEYLMPNGCFFKTPNGRNDLIAYIQAGEMYDATSNANRDDIISQKKQEKAEIIKQRNAELEAEETEIFSLECPVCHKKSVSKISNLGKVAKVYAFGLFGTGDLGKKYKCNICGAKF